ncbi:MAG: hypothetical protein PVF97_02530 [Desulfobacterales bacterium]|jgi:hypothetical protein
MISRDFREFIELLNANEVRYLVVGGYAVAVHGYPRYTKDLDIWIERSAENAARLLKTLDQFGFGAMGISPEDIMAPRQVIQLGYPPNRIDLVTDLTGLIFKECYPAKTTIAVEGLDVDFIDPDNLKRNKAATGRAQDLADIENLTDENEK